MGGMEIGLATSNPHGSRKDLQLNVLKLRPGESSVQASVIVLR